MSAEIYGPVTGSIYWIAAGCPPSAIKIGFTSHAPESRLTSLQTGNHRHLQLLAQVPGNREYEAELHLVHEEDHLIGEWFNPSDYVFTIMADQVKASRR